MPLTPYPQISGADNAALLRLVVDYEVALRKCNADKYVINEVLESARHKDQ